MRTQRRPGVILIFGENLNDSQSIKELLLASNSALDHRHLKALPKPMSLTREAKSDAVHRWITQLDSAVRAHSASAPVRGIVVHRDADGPDPDGARYQQLAEQLRPLTGHAVVPVQAIEAWWFLFPDAVEAVRPSAWRGLVPRRSRDVERISNPKAELCRATRTPGAPEYAEADSPAVARNVRRLALTPNASCPSFERLVTTATSLR